MHVWALDYVGLGHNLFVNVLGRVYEISGSVKVEIDVNVHW